MIGKVSTNNSINGEIKSTTDALKVSLATNSTLSATVQNGEKISLRNYYTKDEVDKIADSKGTFEVSTYLLFPNIGDKNTLYIDTSTYSLYIWNDTDMKYNCVGRGSVEFDIIDGGGA